MLYVEELIAPDVINTMPEATLRAFADHGDVRGRRSASTRAQPSATLRRAQDAGIDLAAVTAELEREGVRSFCDSYHELLDCIETKLQPILRPATARPLTGPALSLQIPRGAPGWATVSADERGGCPPRGGCPSSARRCALAG